MNLLWLYRVFTFILVAITSLAVIGLCAHTSSTLDAILNMVGLTRGSFPYTTLGITVSAITLVSSALLIVLDFFDNIFTSYLIFEIPWLSILWILWISVGATTLSEGHRIFKGQPCTILNVVALPQARGICEDVHPIGIIALINFALRAIFLAIHPALLLTPGFGISSHRYPVFLYTGALVFVAFTSSSSYSSLGRIH